MSDHTPGPWQIVNRGDFETTIGVPKEDTSCTYLAVAEVDSNHTEADARLIAAAPTYHKVARWIVYIDYRKLLGFAKEHDAVPFGISRNNPDVHDFSELVQACMQICVKIAEGDRE